MRSVLLPRNRYDTIGVAPLIDGTEFDALLGDKAFDANWIVEEPDQRGAEIVISQQPKRLNPLAIDDEMCRWRHLVENFQCKLKDFKRIAMRARKTDTSFEAIIYLVAAIINSMNPHRP